MRAPQVWSVRTTSRPMDAAGSYGTIKHAPWSGIPSAGR